EMTARRSATKVTRLVVAEVNANDYIRRKADEPRVLLVVGRTGLASYGLSNLSHDGRCPSLNNAFHHRRDLIGGHGIENLLPTIANGRLGLFFPFLPRTATASTFVMLVDGVTVAVLNTIDQCGLHAPTAVIEHRVGSGHSQQCGLAGAERE